MGSFYLPGEPKAKSGEEDIRRPPSDPGQEFSGNSEGQTYTEQNEIDEHDKDAAGNANEDIAPRIRVCAKGQRDECDDEAGPGLGKAGVELRFEHGAIAGTQFEMFPKIADFAE